MDIKKYISLIKLNELFKDFPSDELIMYFTDNAYSICNYKKNSIIHFESEKCMTLDIILKGNVIIQRIDEDGNTLTIVEFQAGDSIGGNLLFSRHPYYPMIVTAKSDTTIFHAKHDLVLKLCQSNINFLYEYLAAISDKTAILTNKIKTISMKSIRASIIDFLKYEYYFQKSNDIKLSMTKKELAERLGIQRTSLSRELNKMRKDGLVDYNTHSIIIIDLNLIR